MTIKKKIIIPSEKKLGINLTAEKFKRDGLFFDFPTFEKGYEYPIVIDIDINSNAFKNGLRKGDILISLNNYSFYCKDLSTIKSDFEYEKRSNKYLILEVNE